jgi:hypothetical protein
MMETTLNEGVAVRVRRGPAWKARKVAGFHTTGSWAHETRSHLVGDGGARGGYIVTPEGVVGALVFSSMRASGDDGAVYLSAVVGDRHFFGTRDGWTTDAAVARLARRWLRALIDEDFTERYVSVVPE